MQSTLHEITLENGQVATKINHVYRFVDFETFVDMVDMKRLTLVKPILWDDPYENFILKKLDNRENLKSLVKILQDNNAPNIGLIMFTLCMNKNSLYGQSWSYIYQSDALWRIYNKHSSNISVRIKVAYDTITELQKKNNGLLLKGVTYEDSLNLEDEFKKMFSNDYKHTDITGAITVKRVAFQHEAEMRLIYTDYLNLSRFTKDKKIEPIFLSLANNKVTPNSEKFYQLLEEVSKIFETEPKIKEIPIGNPSDFIESVLLNPMAPNWFDATLSKYCEKNQINYLGKSNLYNFE